MPAPDASAGPRAPGWHTPCKGAPRPAPPPKPAARHCQPPGQARPARGGARAAADSPTAAGPT
ncbi:MAG: hypothetical protein EBS11_14755 [Janthinobacterium sp.]|nr:hypothetical protein [Janthinobacterium sp.]